MYVSEDTFIHLRKAADEQRNRELEYRRIARERATATSPVQRRSLRAFVQRLLHAQYRPQRQLSHT
jgi:hypothetical protein